MSPSSARIAAVRQGNNYDVGETSEEGFLKRATPASSTTSGASSSAGFIRKASVAAQVQFIRFVFPLIAMSFVFIYLIICSYIIFFSLRNFFHGFIP
jgi:hypothetical protein